MNMEYPLVRPTRRYLVIALLGLGLFSAYWVVSAQEGRPLWAPPPLLPTDEATPVTKGVAKKAPAKLPHPTKALRDMPKAADPTLIIPAEVYDVPRPARSESMEQKPGTLGVVHVEGGVPPPMFPPLAPEPTQEKEPIPPPPLPTIETNPLPAPMPILDPTKALIVEPTAKVAQPKKSSMPELPFPPPTVIPEAKKDPIAPLPPPIVLPETKVIPEAKKDPIAPPPTMPLPPPIVLPETKATPPAAPAKAQPERPRAFVRIESALNDASPSVVGRPGPSANGIELAQRQAYEKRFSPPLASPAGIGASGLLNLQTPSVSVAKRGSGMIRAHETQSYQIVVRNLGPVPAQQVQIDDELPPNAKIVSADPMPQVQGNRAVWILSTVNVNQEQVLRLVLQSVTDTELTGRTIVHVAAASQTSTTVLRPRNDAGQMAIQLNGPNQVAMGKPAVFEVRVFNQSAQPLTGIVLHGLLPEGLNTPQGRAIEGEVDATIAPGESKTLKMPTSAVKPGRYTVAVKVTTQAGHEASATSVIDIAAEGLHLQQAPAARLFVGRDGDLRVKVANHTGKLLRNVAVADRLPDGLDFVAASERGLYQANSRTVYWLIDQLPADKTQTLVVRVSGAKAGQHQNIVFAKADGVGETQSTGVVALEGISDLTLRVVDRDNPLELGKEAVYEILVQNPGNAPARNVQLQVQFPAGLMPKNAEGNTKFSMDRQTVLFEPIPSLGPQGQAIYRVSALAQSMGDQRVRFAVASEQVRLPIQREISTKVYSDRNP